MLLHTLHTMLMLPQCETNTTVIHQKSFYKSLYCNYLLHSNQGLNLELSPGLGLNLHQGLGLCLVVSQGHEQSCSVVSWILQALHT